jgi:NADH-ubiquinone oxidoreductase chain 2
MQYSISNLNAFFLLIAIGYTYYMYTNPKENTLKDKNNSPIQFTSQLKGYFYINPLLAISLCITIYSFVGIPPLVGFFAKQMVLSAALSEGYIFMALVAILTSVISAVYYLGIIRQIFFEKSDYSYNHSLKDQNLGYTLINNGKENNKVLLKYNAISISTSLSITISILTLVILLFMFNAQE